MLTLQNPFKSTPEDLVKGAQLALGRAKKTVESRTREHAEVCELLTRARVDLADALDQGLDTAAVMRVIVKTETAVRQTEAVLQIARQREQAAQDALRQAQDDVLVEAQMAAFRHLQLDVGPKVDKIFADLRQLVTEELVPAFERCQKIAPSSELSSLLVNAKLEFSRVLDYHVRAFTGTGLSGHAAFMLHTQWSKFLPDPEQLIRKKRPANKEVV